MQNYIKKIDLWKVADEDYIIDLLLENPIIA